MQSAAVVSSPVNALGDGKFVRVVDVGRTIGTITLKEGGAPTSFIKIFTDRAGNLNYCISSREWQMSKSFQHQWFKFVDGLPAGTLTANEFLRVLQHFLLECSGLLDDKPFAD